MARNGSVLNDLKVKSAKPKDKIYYLTDEMGLRLLIRPCGKKLWEFRYTSPVHKKQRKTSFGLYPVVSLSEARTKRDEYLKFVFDGNDPIDIKNDLKKQKDIESDVLKSPKILFEDVAYEWLEYDKNQKDLVKRHADRKYNLFYGYINPFFKDRDINSITSDEVNEMLQQKAQTATETAHRIYQMLLNMYNYAMFKKYTTKNIMIEIPKEFILKPIKKQHFKKITDERILKELLNSIDSLSAWDSARIALQIVALIPLRAENLCNLKWSQIDFTRGIITIPRKDMKIKDTNLDDFKIPMSTQAIKILKEHQEKLGFYDYVFISQTLRKPISNETPNKALQRMGFNDDKHQRLHSFRGTFRSLVDTYQIKHNATFEVKERILDHHEKSQVVRAYAHKADYIEQMRDLLQWWADYLDRVKAL